jgi:hypothetical protein
MSKPNTSSAAATTAAATNNDAIVLESGSSYRFPSSKTLQHAVRLSIIDDKPIMVDYWTGSLDKTVLIGVRDDDTKEKILVRSEEEYTSPISKIFKIEQEYIIVTENSIYVVDVGIPTKRISA